MLRRGVVVCCTQADYAVFSSSNVAAAYAFAARAHEGQYRKSGEPVLAHLVATARILAELGLPEEVVAAGLLHDVLCDTPTTASQLAAVLPNSVVSLVSRVSQLNQLSQNYRDNTHSLEAEAMLDMLTGRCGNIVQFLGSVQQARRQVACCHCVDRERRTHSTM